jgi:hypothetical protein
LFQFAEPVPTRVGDRVRNNPLQLLLGEPAVGDHSPTKFVRHLPGQAEFGLDLLRDRLIRLGLPQGSIRGRCQLVKEKHLPPMKKGIARREYVLGHGVYRQYYRLMILTTAVDLRTTLPIENRPRHSDLAVGLGKSGMPRDLSLTRLVRFHLAKRHLSHLH